MAEEERRRGLEEDERGDRRAEDAAARRERRERGDRAGEKRVTGERRGRARCLLSWRREGDREEGVARGARARFRWEWGGRALGEGWAGAG